MGERLVEGEVAPDIVKYWEKNTPAIPSEPNSNGQNKSTRIPKDALANHVMGELDDGTQVIKTDNGIFHRTFRRDGMTKRLILIKPS